MKSLGVIPRSSASGIGSYSSPNSKAYGDPPFHSYHMSQSLNLSSLKDTSGFLQ